MSKVPHLLLIVPQHMGSHIQQGIFKLRELHLGFICVVKTRSGRGRGGRGEDGQLIDQTASRLLIYSDRKSINSFSLISPPLLSHRSSLSSPDSDLDTLFSSAFVIHVCKWM